LACQDLARQEAEQEPTGTYLRRVLAGHTHPSSQKSKPALDSAKDWNFI
jgi:hypothetical protein